MASPTKFTNLEKAFVTYATKMQTASPAYFEELKEKVARIVKTVETVFAVIDDRSQYLQTKFEHANELLKHIDSEDPEVEEPSILKRFAEQREKAALREKMLRTNEKTKKAYGKFLAIMKEVTSLEYAQHKDIKILKKSVLGDHAIKIDFITDCLKGYKHQYKRLSKEKTCTSGAQIELSQKLTRVVTWVNSFNGNLNELHLAQTMLNEELQNAHGTHLKGFKTWQKEIEKLKTTLKKINKEATELNTEVTQAKIAAPQRPAIPTPTKPSDKPDLVREIEILELRVELYRERARNKVLNGVVSTEAKMSPIHKELKKLAEELEEKKRLLALEFPNLTPPQSENGGEPANHPSVTEAQATGDEDLVRATLASLIPSERGETPVVDALVPGSIYFNEDASLPRSISL